MRRARNGDNGSYQDLLKPDTAVIFLKRFLVRLSDQAGGQTDVPECHQESEQKCDNRRQTLVSMRLSHFCSLS